MDEKKDRRNCETCGAYDAVMDSCGKHMDTAEPGQCCEGWEADEDDGT